MTDYRYQIRGQVKNETSVLNSISVSEYITCNSLVEAMKIATDMVETFNVQDPTRKYALYSLDQADRVTDQQITNIESKLTAMDLKLDKIISIISG